MKGFIEGLIGLAIGLALIFIEWLIGLALIFGGLYYYFNYHDMGGGKVGDFMRDVKAVYEINKQNEQKNKP